MPVRLTWAILAFLELQPGNERKETAASFLLRDASPKEGTAYHETEPVSELRSQERSHKQPERAVPRLLT